MADEAHDSAGEDDVPIAPSMAPDRAASRSTGDGADRSRSVVGSGIGDAQLVEEARRGDGDAFGELVRRYERRLLRVIGRFVSDQELARDLAQETFLRVYERLDRFDTSRRFGPWLFRIGVNRTLDFLRKRKRRGRWALFSESPHEQGPDPAVADPRPHLDLEQEVAAILEQIPEKYRMVLVLRDLENFPTSEIAAITGRKEATIRWRLAEARNRFRKLWTKRLGETDSDTDFDETSFEEGDDDAGR
jgi:RNA polymerase sigma-70 factor, ECF subfamily